MKVVRQVNVTVAKSPAASDFTTQGPSPDGKGVVTSRNRLFFAGGSFYALSVTSSVNKPLPADADRFILSFKLGKSIARVVSLNSDATPEDAWRMFTYAMITHDEPTLRAVTSPSKELEWLMRGEIVPKEEWAEAREEITKLAVRRLNPAKPSTFPAGAR